MTAVIRGCMIVAMAVLLTACVAEQNDSVRRGKGSLRIVARGLEGPRALALDRRGVLYAVSGDGAKVTCIFADGSLVEAPAGCARVAAVAADPTGALVYADPLAGDVVRVSKEGTRTLLASGLSRPSALAVDRDGGVYVACQGDGTVRWLSPGVR